MIYKVKYEKRAQLSIEKLDHQIKIRLVSHRSSAYEIMKRLLSFLLSF
jgi:hypothetical protein